MWGQGLLANPQFAILLDGGFLTKKLSERLSRHVTADDIVTECDRLRSLDHVKGCDLLRIYYYDAHPSSDGLKKPVSGDQMNLSESARYRSSQQLYDQLIMKPNVALRMGHVALTPNKWKMKPKVARELITSPRALTDDDFILDAGQKGVDMRIGMDIARLALREMVRTLIAVTGDSDFVPAFKFARREGVKIILEPMGNGGRIELRQHADIVLETPRPPKAIAAAATAATSN
jgi:uncharacterized LabA/DUF88 family protein